MHDLILEDMARPFKIKVKGWEWAVWEIDPKSIRPLQHPHPPYIILIAVGKDLH